MAADSEARMNDREAPRGPPCRRECSPPCCGSAG